MQKNHRMYIDGAWTESSDKTSFDVFNPFTGERLAGAANGNKEDAQKAIKAAAMAYPLWAATPPTMKRLLFLKAADVLEKRKDEIARLLAEETGAARPFAMFQALSGPNYLREAGSQVHRVIGKTLPAESAKLSIVLRQPVGVVAGISPWNCPVVLSLRAVCFAIAYGNTAVLKPSEETPLSGGVILAEVFEEAGFPKGVLNVLTHGYGRSAEIGNEFITDKRIKRISFTGSTRVGRELAEKAGRHLKKISLELGGNDPLIILKDANIDYAVNVAIFGRFLHQGQVCMNAKRLIVEEQVVEEFTEKLVKRVLDLKVGNPLDADTLIGPLINKRQLELIHSQVEKAQSEGAHLLCGGKSEGLCYYPTVLAGIREDMAIFHEETFGPVAPIIIAKDAEDALRIANNSDYGLASGIITGDTQKGLELAERLEAGSTHVNDSPLHGETHAPFGGIKDSGWGKFGMEALEEFTELHWVTIQKGERKFPF